VEAVKEKNDSSTSFILVGNKSDLEEKRTIKYQAG